MRKILAALILTPVLLAILTLGGANLAATRAGWGHLYDDPSAVPAGDVGLVFGCSPRIGKRENLYFRHRIKATAELWREGKLTCVIVSGDNRTQYYNEPQEMTRALVSEGVPEGKIVSDYAGLRTLDSVVRAKEVFGLERVVFISQRFQNERAAYLAKSIGLEYIGYNARDVSGKGGAKTKLREAMARVKMWMDVHLLNTRPRHLGERETLPL